jgi:hypothetical protein
MDDRSRTLAPPRGVIWVPFLFRIAAECLRRISKYSFSKFSLSGIQVHFSISILLSMALRYTFSVIQILSLSVSFIMKLDANGDPNTSPHLVAMRIISMITILFSSGSRRLCQWHRISLSLLKYPDTYGIPKHSCSSTSLSFPVLCSLWPLREAIVIPWLQCPTKTIVDSCLSCLACRAQWVSRVNRHALASNADRVSRR